MLYHHTEKMALRLCSTFLTKLLYTLLPCNHVEELTISSIVEAFNSK